MSSDKMLPPQVAARLVQLSTNPAYLAQARPWFPKRDVWRSVDDAGFWRMVLSQVCVVGSSASWDRIMASGEMDTTLAFGSLARLSGEERTKVLHGALRRHGVRYTAANIQACRKTTNLIHNHQFLLDFPGGSASYLSLLAGLPTDEARVGRVARDLKYIKSKGARDLLIELDLGRTLVAFDVRVLNVMKMAGAILPDDVQSSEKRYRELLSALLDRICEPAGLSGSEFDRIVYRNYDAMMEELRQG